MHTSPHNTSSITVALYRHRVRFARSGERVLMSCDCERGTRGLECAHPWGALLGNPEMLPFGALVDAARARQLVAGTSLEAALERREQPAGRTPAIIEDHPVPFGRGEVATNLGMGSSYFEEAP